MYTYFEKHEGHEIHSDFYPVSANYSFSCPVKVAQSLRHFPKTYDGLDEKFP